MGYIDTHCHLNDVQYEKDLDEIIATCQLEGIEMMIVVGYDMPSSRRAIEICDKYEHIYAAIGFHPSDADKYNEESEAELISLSKHQKVIAIGEIGLEYHWEDVPTHEIQQAVFKKQIELAQKLALPIIIHNREAMEDTFKILEAYKPIKGIMHCFSGSKEMAERFIKQGLYISFAGPITFKNAITPKEVAKVIPLNSLLVETDCPYLTPHPYRGKLNYPYYVKQVVEEIANLRGMEVEELQKRIKDNVYKLFDTGKIRQM